MSGASPAPVGYWEYGWEKCKRQPLVPLGVLATCAALIGASASLRKGNREQFNKYLRFRVAAQGVTVVAAVAGTYFLTNKPQQVRDRRQQVLTNQLPPDPDSIISAAPESGLIAGKTTSSKELATSSLQTHGKGQGEPASPSTSKSESNRFERVPRISQTMQQTEKALEGGEGAVKPRRVSEFGKRLEEAERLQRESDK